jgi:hypothetical protein
MATYYVIKGATDLGAAASYSSTLTGAGGAGTPSAGDTVYFPYQVRITANYGASGGLDPGTNGLEAVYVYANISCAGTLVIGCNASADSVVDITMTAGTLDLQAGTDAINQLIVRNTGSGAVTLKSGTFDRVDRLSGLLNVDASAVVTEFNGVSGLTREIGANGTAITTFRQMGGYTLSRRTLTTWDNNGTLNLVDDADYTTGNQHEGVCNDRSTADKGTLNVYGGRFTPAGAPFGYTISTLNWYGGQVADQAGGVQLIITTPNNFSGGTYFQDQPGNGYDAPVGPL